MTASWTLVAPTPKLEHPRARSRVFWTGSSAALVGNGYSAMYGATLDRAMNAWNNGSYARISWRDQFVAAWTGAEVVVWGGASDLGPLSDGGAYSPETGAWRPLPTSPLAGRSAATAVWTDSELVVVGGGTDHGDLFGDGAAYEPEKDSWRLIAPPPLEPRFGASAAWTGEEMVVWGGVDATGFPEQGAAYRPATDTWRRVASGPLRGRMDCTAVWTGDELLFWGGTRRSADEGPFADGASYDPREDRWRPLPASPLTGRYGHGAVWARDRMIVWGGADTLESDAPPHLLADGASLDPAAGRWERLPDGFLAARYQHSLLWSGEDVVVVGGCCPPDISGSFQDAAALVPA